MAMTFERHDAAGAPWCPPRDAVVLRRWITDRSRELGGGIRRIVRLARLAALADGRDYVRFLYVRLPALRARHFQSALEAAAAEGRLSPALALVSPTGVVLREGASIPPSATSEFAIDFGQMPRLAALLDFLHNSLGFAVIADILAPVSTPGAAAAQVPAAQSDDVARALHAALNAWLAQRLESPHHIRQAQKMRAFLASRGRVEPEAIDDEAILSFWEAMTGTARDDEVEGFRLYRSAASALLHYRQALRDAAAASAVAAPASLGSDLDEVDLDRLVPDEPRLEEWQSPLRALAMPPADAVKWLTKKEWRQLLDYLGGPDHEGPPEEAEEADEPEDWGGGLAGAERFDLGFLRTLFRADVFGTAQSAIVARLAKRAPAEIAIAQAMHPIADAAYEGCATAYAAVREQLRLECLAALAALLEAGAAEALILLDHFAGRDAAAAILASSAIAATSSDETEPAVDDAFRRRIAPALRAVAVNPGSLPAGPLRDLIAEARAAARKINRIGFRSEDRSEASMLAAMGRGAAAVIEVIGELDRLTKACSERIRGGDVAADRARFFAAFTQIYLAAPQG